MCVLIPATRKNKLILVGGVRAPKGGGLGNHPTSEDRGVFILGLKSIGVSFCHKLAERGFFVGPPYIAFGAISPLTPVCLV